jgi:hypothetical protein
MRFALGKVPSERFLFRLAFFRLALKHELLHFLREVEKLENRNVSLFRAETECKSILHLYLLILREESLVWFRTFW